MDLKRLTVINKSLLFCITGLVAFIIFLIDYLGPQQFETILIFIGGFLFTWGYQLGRNINHNWIRRSINILLTVSLSGMAALVLFFWTQSSPEGPEWFYWILFISIPCGLLASSIRHSIRYWNRTLDSINVTGMDNDPIT